MRKMLFGSLLFFGCSAGPDRNKMMTDFINQKKVIEDSIIIAKSLEADYYSKAREEMRTSNDSLKYKPFIDSSVKYSIADYRLRKKLTSISFSIDSLSKMK